jgi:hypothetical protein
MIGTTISKISGSPGTKHNGKLWGFEVGIAVVYQTRGIFKVVTEYITNFLRS